MDNLQDFVGAAVVALGVLFVFNTVVMRKLKQAARREKKPKVVRGPVWEDPMPWAKVLGPRCDARLKRGQDPQFYGRCDLEKGHYTESGTDDHCLERGMIWVRWNKRGHIYYEQPYYEDV